MFLFFYVAGWYLWSVKSGQILRQQGRDKHKTQHKHNLRKHKIQQMTNLTYDKDAYLPYMRPW